MGLVSRIFGRRTATDEELAAQLQAKRDIAPLLSLQVVFAEHPQLTAPKFGDALQQFHPSMARARCEFDQTLAGAGKLFGLVGWGRHVVQVVGFDHPLPEATVEQCIAQTRYLQEVKDMTRAHRAHVNVYYVGYETSALEQYVALAAVAGTLARFGAISVLNEVARSSQPIDTLTAYQARQDSMERLRKLPLPALYCGFMKYPAPGAGVWMRTHGAYLLGQPELAALASDHQQSGHYFNTFDGVLRILLSSGEPIKAGDSMPFTQGQRLQFKAADATVECLHSESLLLVVETLGPRRDHGSVLP